MAVLSGIITPTNILTETSTASLTNKTLVAPALGTPASGVLTNTTGLPLTTGVTGTLPVANGGTGADTLTGVLKGNGTSAVTAANVDLTSEVTGALPTINGGTGLSTLGTAGQALVVNSGATALEFASVESVVQYPQNSQSADYTLVLSDAGKQIFHPASDNNGRTFTIPANSSVAFPIGTVVLFTAENGGRAVGVGITSDTLVFGSGTTGGISIAQNNTLMCIKVTATKWMANYLYQTGVPIEPVSIAVSHSTSPFVTAYPFSVAGFGTKFTNPATPPANVGRGVAFSPAGDAIAVAHFGSPSISAYPFSSSGFGAKFTDPATLPAGTGTDVSFSPDADAIAVSHESSPFVSAYPWSSVTGFGTKYANPATLPAGAGTNLNFSPAGDAIAVTVSTATLASRFIAYPWSVGGGFGAKIADPSTVLTGAANGVAFSPAGDAIALAHNTTPFVSAYPFSVAGFGTKFTNPATLPTGNGRSVAFSPAGDAIAVGHATSPFVSAYSFSSSGFGTKFTDPATLPTSSCTGIAFSPTGDAIGVSNESPPYVGAYPFSGAGFGTRLANPATLPAGVGEDVAFNSF